MDNKTSNRITDREDKYHQKRMKVLSPDRKDPLQFMYNHSEEANEDDTYKGRMMRQ